MKTLLRIPPILACLLLAAAAARADSYDTLRLLWREMLVGPPTYNTSDPAIADTISSITTAAQGYWSSMDTSSGRTDLWSDLTGTTHSSYVTSAYTRLEAMAAAYATYGSSLYGSSSLLSDLVGALDWMNANRYSASTASYDNWWDWQIGTPLELNNLTAILYASLTSTQIANYMAAIHHFTASPSGTGANLMWTCKVVGLYGVITKTSASITSATSSLTSLFADVTSGDGFHADGSFLQHSYYAYNGAYGLSLIVDVLDYMELYAGSSWAVTTSSQKNVYPWLYDSFEPLVYKGEMADAVRGRVISRYDDVSHQDGRTALGAFIRATQIAAAPDAAAYKSAIKYWLGADTTFSNPCDGLSIYNTVLAEAINTDPGVVSRGELTGCYAFPAMDRVMHLSTGWGASLALFSSRIADFESINSENLKGWHTGDGALQVYTADEEQFSNNLWPTIDNDRIPGSTVEHATALSANARSGTGLVGSASSWDGTHGVAGMALDASGSTLRGDKAWFFFSKEIVCLGAGITASGGKDVETIVENRQLTAAGTNAVSVNNGTPSTHAPVAEPAPPFTFTGVNYMHMTGNVTGGDIGFYFPGGTTLGAIRESRAHAWSEINQGSARIGNTTLYTDNYYTLWFDHGTNPTGAAYQYVELPNMSSTQVASYAAAPEVSVIENSTAAQTVKQTSLGEIGAMFWASSSHTTGTGADAITASTASAIYEKADGNCVEISVSDPTQAGTSIAVTLGASALSVIDNDPGITVTQLSPAIQFTAAVSGLHGVPLHARFSQVAGGIVTVDDVNANNTGGSTATATGAWTSSTATAGYWDTDYLHNGNAGQGTKSCTFTPNLTAAGQYEVQIWYTSATNRATNVPVDVHTSSGTSTVTVDQTSGGGAWVSLGTYSFGTGTSGYVTVRTDGTSGYVVADAARFILR